ncbi:unnamed protein product [Dicrocoelium dendriticum]|nr:unnamed protein product [Dicrocoelium dendriticum]
MHPGGYVEEVLVESTFPGGAVAQLRRTFASDFIHYTRSVRLPPSTAFDIYRCRTVHPETTLYDTSVVSSVRQTFVFTDCEYNPALYPSFREGLYNICSSPIEIRNPMLPDIVSRRCRTMAISQETRLYHPVNTLACQPTLPQRLVGTRCPGISLCAREEIRPQSSMLTTYQEEYGGQQWREMETVPGNCDASVLFSSWPPAAYCQWYPYLSPSCVPGAIQSTITQSRAIQCVPSLIRPSSSFAPLTSYSKVSQTLCAGRPGDWIQHSSYSTLSGTRSPHVIHSSSLIRENRCPELLTNIPIRPVERFEFDTCLPNATDPSFHPPGVTVMRKYSAEWEAPPRPKASCVRCALNPAPQSDIVASLNAPNYACRITFHSEEPSCSSISRVTSVRHGREMDTYVVSSAMVQNPPVMQTSDGTFLVSDTLKSESGRFVGPIPLDRTTVACSQVDPILHPHRTRPQFQLLGSSLYPPPRGCFIRTVTATDVQRVIPKPPPPTTPNRKSWNRDSSWNYLREMRESRARSPFGLFPRAASPLGQASDCSFLVSERSEITRSGAPPHGSSASPVGFFGYDDTTTTVTTTYRADFQDPRLYQKRAEIQCYLGSKLLESTRSPSPFGHPTRYASHIGVERSHTASSMRLFPTIPVQTTTTGPRLDKPQQRRRNLEPKASPKSPKAPLKSSRRSPRNTGNTNQMTGKRETGKQQPDLLPCGHLKNLPQKLEEVYAMVERLANFRSCECTLSSEQIQPDKVQTQPSKWDTNLAAKSTITPLIREASTQVGESPGPTQPPTPTQPEDNQAKYSTSDAIFVTPSPPTSRSRESSINDLRRERQGSKTILKTATPPKDRTPSVVKPYGNLDKRGAWQHSIPSRRRRGSDEGLSEETGPEINDTSTIDGVYTDDEVETVDSLESTTSETSLYSAVITDPIPLGVTVEVRIAHTFTACDSEMDDLFVDTEVVCKHTSPIFNYKVGEPG